MNLSGRDCKLLSNKLKPCLLLFFFLKYFLSRSFVYFLKGDAGDSLAYHNRMKFSTKDSDNDVYSYDNCAVDRKGSWWYKRCHYSNLNGLYLGAGQTSGTGIRWYYWKSQSMKQTEMKVRLTQF